MKSHPKRLGKNPPVFHATLPRRHWTKPQKRVHQTDRKQGKHHTNRRTKPKIPRRPLG